MDRRQRKTREAIFHAFTELLAQKDVSRITVGEIIARANVGRATFYAHFETKDLLLKALCQELFGHIFHRDSPDYELFACHAPDSAFLHLFQHLRKNDHQILQLLTCPNNALFLQYFRQELRALVQAQLPALCAGKDPALPEDFWVAHVTATFIETLQWWIAQQLTQDAETITHYFMLALHAGPERTVR